MEITMVTGGITISSMGTTITCRGIIMELLGLTMEFLAISMQLLEIKMGCQGTLTEYLVIGIRFKGKKIKFMGVILQFSGMEILSTDCFRHLYNIEQIYQPNLPMLPHHPNSHTPHCYSPSLSPFLPLPCINQNKKQQKINLLHQSNRKCRHKYFVLFILYQQIFPITLISQFITFFSLCTLFQVSLAMLFVISAQIHVLAALSLFSNLSIVIIIIMRCVMFQRLLESNVRDVRLYFSGFRVYFIRFFIIFWLQTVIQELMNVLSSFLALFQFVQSSCFQHSLPSVCLARQYS